MVTRGTFFRSCAHYTRRAPSQSVQSWSLNERKIPTPRGSRWHVERHQSAGPCAENRSTTLTVFIDGKIGLAVATSSRIRSWRDCQRPGKRPEVSLKVPCRREHCAQRRVVWQQRCLG